MFCLPFQTSPTEFTVFVFLQEENIARMREYDPAEVITTRLGGEFQKLRLSEIVIGFATEEDFERVMELCQRGEPKEALRHLTRGFRYRPDQGDRDGPYLSVKPGGGKPS